MLFYWAWSLGELGPVRLDCSGRSFDVEAAVLFLSPEEALTPSAWLLLAVRFSADAGFEYSAPCDTVALEIGDEFLIMFCCEQEFLPRPSTIRCFELLAPCFGCCGSWPWLGACCSRFRSPRLRACAPLPSSLSREGSA